MRQAQYYRRILDQILSGKFLKRTQLEILERKGLETTGVPRKITATADLQMGRTTMKTETSALCVAKALITGPLEPVDIVWCAMCAHCG